jgi:hypothetical protein
MKKPFSLREQSEKPLKEIDTVLSDYAGSMNANILLNYRDYPSRTIYWRRGRVVKYIQIRLSETESDPGANIMRYRVFACSYRIRLPFLHFWNMRFDAPSTKCTQLGTLESPVDTEELRSLLNASVNALRDT